MVQICNAFVFFYSWRLCYPSYTFFPDFVAKVKKKKSNWKCKSSVKNVNPSSETEGKRVTLAAYFTLGT